MKFLKSLIILRAFEFFLRGETCMCVCEVWVWMWVGVDVGRWVQVEVIALIFTYTKFVLCVYAT